MPQLIVDLIADALNARGKLPDLRCLSRGRLQRDVDDIQSPALDVMTLLAAKARA
jgi:hypothetical protein